MFVQFHMPIIRITNICTITFFFAESWWVWWMYPHWGFFLWSKQAHVLFSGEWEHPLTWFRWERLWPGNHSHHLWLFYMEGKSILCLSRSVLRNDLYWFHSFNCLCSSTLPKRTEATRARVLAFHAGRSEITTTIPPLTCGCIVLIVATCTMEGNWSAHFPPSPRVTSSPASWTWRLTPYHLLRMTRFDHKFHQCLWFSLRFTGVFKEFYFFCNILMKSLFLGAKVGIWRCGCLWIVPMCVVLQQ